MQDRVDYKSQYGYVIMWFGGPLCWISKKHNLDVLSRQENCACGAMARRLVLVKCSPEHWLTSTKQMA